MLLSDALYIIIMPLPGAPYTRQTLKTLKKKQKNKK